MNKALPITTKTPNEVIVDSVLKTMRNSSEKLNPKQELFCQLYATDREFFGNGVQTYIEVYEPNQSKPNWYNSACVSASQLLSNIKVCNRINELLEQAGFSDIAVDKQLAFLLTQHGDLKTKLGAIKEYNKLKARVTDKSELDVVHKFEEMTDEQLDAAIKARQNRSA